MTCNFFGSSPRRWLGSVSGLLLVAALATATGCGRFRQEQHDTVYVAARQMALHDRVAAVSNRVAEVVNGQKLEVLEHGRRFLRVKTEKNEIGWIEERAVIDGKAYQAFDQLGSSHQKDPVVSTAVVRDDYFLHLTPGRETQRFFLLAANAKIQLLARATVARNNDLVRSIAPKPAAAPSAKAKAPAPNQKAAAKPVTPTPEVPVQLEDWWLVRDGAGHAGWMLASRLDVDVPDEIGTFAEGQRTVGAYILNKVHDPEADVPDHMVPQYLTLMAPPKAGLPFDFDQVRVFTWSLRHHRYETAYRLHPIEGYLPARVTTTAGSALTFSFQIASSANLTTDPTTGVTHPLNPRTVTFTLEDTRVRRIGPDLAPIPFSHLADSQPKSAKNGKNGKAGKKK